MSTIHQIKILQALGYPAAGIADELGLDRKTLRKYLQQTDFFPGGSRQTGTGRAPRAVSGHD